MIVRDDILHSHASYASAASEPNAAWWGSTGDYVELPAADAATAPPSAVGVRAPARDADPDAVHSHSGWVREPHEAWPHGPRDVVRGADTINADTIRTLRFGRVDDARRGRALTTSIHGRLHGTWLHPVKWSPRVQSLMKPVHQGGANEVFAWEFARAIHASHLFAPTARRSDGAAAIELLGGSDAYDLGIVDSDALVRRLTADHRAVRGMSRRDALQTARTTRDWIRVIDYLLANEDRHVWNLRYDPASVRVTLIDHGLIGRPLAPNGVPYVDASFHRAAAARGDIVEERIAPSVIRSLRSADRAHIERAFRTLLRDQRACTSPLSRGASHIRESFLPQLLQRLDDVIATGRIRIRLT